MKVNRLYTPAEVAERYKVKKDTVWTWIRKGKLRASRICGKLYRISEEALAEFEKNAAEVNERKESNNGYDKKQGNT